MSDKWVDKKYITSKSADIGLVSFHNEVDISTAVLLEIRLKFNDDTTSTIVIGWGVELDSSIIFNNCLKVIVNN